MTPSPPSIFVLNGTCLEVADALGDWIKNLDVNLHTDPALATLSGNDRDRAVAGADALIVPAGGDDGFPAAAHMAQHASLKVLSIAASGHEWLDMDAATEHGIVVTGASTPLLAETVADLTFGLILAVARQIPEYHQRAQRGDYQRGIDAGVWGKTLGVVGAGRIGQAVARRARGFDMRVLAATREPNPERESALKRDFGIETVSLDRLLEESDFVSLHVRLNPQTRGMIGDRELRMMKPTAILINTARRDLIDETALTQRLASGLLGGAGLDDPPATPDSPLPTMPNVVITPHIGNRARDGMVAVFKSAIEQAVTALNGQMPDNVLNPRVYQSPHLRLRAAADAS